MITKGLRTKRPALGKVNREGFREISVCFQLTTILEFITKEMINYNKKSMLLF